MSTGVRPYPRAMERRSGGLFAGRRIGPPGLATVAIAVVVAFALGMLTAWLTSFVPDLYQRWQATPAPSVSASPSGTPTPEVTVGPLPAIDREMDDADRAAGLVSLVVPDEAAGTFTPVPGTTAEVDGAGPVRAVRIDVEDGLSVDGETFAAYVLGVLNDPRGWASQGRQQFVQTQGVADIRVVLASPHTIAALCRPTDATAEPEPSPSPSPSAVPQPTCEEQSIVPLSLYDWAAGLERYGEDRAGSRQYQLSHLAGYRLGEEMGQCTSGRASVMVVQERMPGECSVNPWPFPDAPVPDPAAS